MQQFTHRLPEGRLAIKCYFMAVAEGHTGEPASRGPSSVLTNILLRTVPAEIAGRWSDRIWFRRIMIYIIHAQNIVCACAQHKVRRNTLRNLINYFGACGNIFRSHLDHCAAACHAMKLRLLRCSAKRNDRRNLRLIWLE